MAGRASFLIAGGRVTRYLLLLSAYQTRDNATLLLAASAACAVLVWPLLDALPPPFQRLCPRLSRIYSLLLLLAWIVILIVCVFFQKEV